MKNEMYIQMMISLTAGSLIDLTLSNEKDSSDMSVCCKTVVHVHKLE
jgi:hypothetical protein